MSHHSVDLERNRVDNTKGTKTLRTVHLSWVSNAPPSVLIKAKFIYAEVIRIELNKAPGHSTFGGSQTHDVWFNEGEFN